METPDGVAIEDVRSIQQDALGYLWIGCQGGLFRFDGEAFRYYHSNNRERYVPFEEVAFTLGRKPGELLLWNGERMAVFNYLDGTYELMEYEFPGDVGDFEFQSAKIDQQGVLWASARLDMDDGRRLHCLYKSLDFSRLGLVKKFSAKGETLNLALGQQGVLHAEGPLVFETDQDGETLVQRRFPTDISQIQLDEKGTLWALGGGRVFTWPEGAAAPRALAINGGPFGAFLVGNGQVLLASASGSGLYLFDLSAGTSQLLGEGFFLTKTIARDRTGSYWLGGASLVKMEPRPGVRHFLTDQISDCGGTSCLVRCMQESRDGRLIVGHAGGTLLLDLANGQSSGLPAGEAGLPKANTSTHIAENADWLVLDNLVFNKKNGTYRYLEASGPAEAACIFDGGGRLWLGITSQAEMTIHNLATGWVLRSKAVAGSLPPGEELRFSQLLPDGQDGLWVLTHRHGLYRVDGQGQLLDFMAFDPEEEHSLLSRESFCAALAADGGLWIGSSMGLSRLDPATGKFRHFTVDNGLPGPQVFSIVEEPGQGLWLGTGMGLSFFHLETESFVNFSQKDGLKNPAYQPGAALRTRNGQLCFGGPAGIDVFSHEDLLNTDFDRSLPMFVTRLTYFDSQKGRTVTRTDGLEQLPSITLRPEDKFFSLRFRLADLRTAANTQYSYKMEGYDEAWSVPSEDNELRYENLPPGKYHLLIRAAISPGAWNENELAIEVVKRQVWYTLWWVLSLFGILLSLIVFWFYRRELSRKLEHEEAIRLKELDTVKSRLYTNITHEFRTPITVILGNLEIMKLEIEKVLASLPISQFLISKISISRRNGQDLLRLVNQLLDLAKLESGTMRMDAVRGNVVNYLRYLADSFYLLAEERGIRFTFYAEQEEIEMDFDEVKLQHVVHNLLSNAMKFTPAQTGGEVVFHVKKLEKNGQSWLQMKVRDTGSGIPEGQLAHIFDRFYQVDGSDTRQGTGTGIGLALAKELVQLMEGEIVVESRLGEGSSFIVQLPVRTESARLGEGAGWENVQEKDTPLPVSVLPEANELTENGGPDREHLLIVEDNPDVASYIRSCLDERYSVAWAKDGQEGIDMALDIVPDVILCDVMMPKKNGFEVTETLKRDERTSHVPIVLLTARADMESRIEGLERGADAYLAKPFEKRELLVRLEKLVELRQRLQRRYSKIDQLENRMKTEPDAAVMVEDAFLLKLQSVLADHLGEADFSVVHLCKKTRMSQSQLYRKVKALTGRSIAAYMRSYRLERAKDLLQNSELNVSEVAYEVGFSDPAYFSRSFSEEFGMPPNEWRK